MRKKQILLCLLIICLMALSVVAVLLGEGSIPWLQNTEPTVPTYSVRFVAAGEEYATQKVQEGEMPEMVAFKLTGWNFYAWLDESGRAVAPHEIPIYEDTAFYAECYPDLTGDVAYLSVDQNGFLRPDDILTVKEMTDAFAALAAVKLGDFEPEFSGLPGENTEVTAQVLYDCLCVLFPEDSVTRALSNTAGDSVTRGAFAGVMNDLTDRQMEKVILSDGAQMPLDLSAGHAWCADLMEASLAHTHGDDGDTWAAVAQNLGWKPGFMNIDGRLLYVQENGTVLRDGKVGELTFAADGRYTSSDAELDAFVSGILAEIIEKNPEAQRIDLLRRAFEYSRDSFTYLRRAAYAFGATGWEIEDAKKMFDTSKGNCYNFAASFWALARGLGYEAKCISGTMTKTDQPHSWVEIVMDDGKPYIFDPQMEYAYVHERDIFDKDMFMVTYIAGAWWNYKRP